MKRYTPPWSRVRSCLATKQRVRLSHHKTWTMSIAHTASGLHRVLYNAVCSKTATIRAFTGTNMRLTDAYLLDTDIAVTRRLRDSAESVRILIAYIAIATVIYVRNCAHFINYASNPDAISISSRPEAAPVSSILRSPGDSPGIPSVRLTGGIWFRWPHGTHTTRMIGGN